MTTTPTTHQDVEVVVRKRHAFSAVPDALLEDRRLSLAARAVAGWMLGRPPAWRLMLGHMKYNLGISDKQWTGIRKELTAAGYYSQKKERGVSATGKQGVWKWTHTVTDDPIFSIPPFCMDGERTHAARSGAERKHAERSDAGGGDIPDEHNTSINTVVNTVLDQSKENLPTKPPHQTLDPSGPGFGGDHGGGDQDGQISEEEQEHLDAAIWQEQKKKPVDSVDGFRTTLLRRWRSSGAGGGFSQRDRDTLRAFRLAQRAVEEEEQGHSVAVAKLYKLAEASRARAGAGS